MLERLLRGEPYYHLWYLYMALGLYLAAPFVARIVENLSAGNAWLLAGAILTVSAIAAPFGMRGYFFTLFLPYLGYFIAGYLLSVEPPTIPLKALVATIVALGIIIALAAAGPSPRAVDIAYGYFNPVVIILSIAIFLLFEHFPEVSFVAHWERYSFGIYLLHPFWLAVLAKIGVSGLTATPFLGIPLTVALATLLSAGTTRLMLQRKAFDRLI